MFTQGFSISGSSLKLLKPGERGVVAKLRQTDDITAQALKSVGIVPGTTIHVEQTFPRFLVRIGSEKRALSEAMIHAVYVRLGDRSSSAKCNSFSRVG
ncbi:MAG: ferrous iron transport protein A [Synechococcales bacterium]|nr:ferrous iron transport protein A [Synechococcales bacterium]